jgi:hypothetical protein
MPIYHLVCIGLPFGTQKYETPLESVTKTDVRIAVCQKKIGCLQILKE